MKCNRTAIAQFLYMDSTMESIRSLACSVHVAGKVFSFWHEISSPHESNLSSQDE
jgi:hypothetical protein